MAKYDLVVNVAELVAAAESFAGIANEMDAIKNNLQKHINTLASETWVSKGGETFQKQYCTGWSTNCAKYTALLRELSEMLISAASEYSQLGESIESKPLQTAFLI